ncbi:hypothetical protein Cylst_3520 [Cylindrospermum stagnale PCC 7417]|uniref:Uncharacterized protein n=1 Tax=Cylindrospermum stagnale PCC 7417 TaxID=56107 RepID=K9X0S2_9NOST|nr:hypothetical protein Cylst_3520 [Cylindrospermum stagnale PCC 7417]
MISCVNAFRFTQRRTRGMKERYIVNVFVFYGLPIINLMVVIVSTTHNIKLLWGGHLARPNYALNSLFSDSSLILK